ncbi:putative homogentisate phytyltransferase 2, chloroplastic [Zea mays]|uniref:Putative homogentisate phytyltransferase 2, chloroplastic n=1 Tax=Zea mays TaxID=4577 RepID=A0A3L6G398_MAIZE|nr:hypothetical protein Zm00014a_030106 [Zea mays]PWZ41260.1 hypothetical protein Zm00014a_030106 [Zea mays]PWZ41261.1 putative homogentisate phytyltransferase 2, chloroplastic [Zea mays]
MAPLASLPLPPSTAVTARFLAAPAIRVISPSRPALPLLSSASAGGFPHASRAPCSAAREHRRGTVRECSRADAAGAAPLSKTLLDLKDSCWRFLRPHTIRGTALGSIALVARALIENSHLINWWLIFKAFYGLGALIFGNGYIVGINQIYDVAIDKVNKPYLPIAAGDLSIQSAWLLVILFAAAGFSIVISNFGPFITSLYCLGLFLGTIYSVPPFRLKRYPVAAFLIIATVRGFLLNFGVYYATRAALGLTFQWRYQISTLATKLGVRNIAFLGSGLLLANYIAAIAVAFTMPQAFRCTVMVPVHAVLAGGLIFQHKILVLHELSAFFILTCLFCSIISDMGSGASEVQKGEVFQHTSCTTKDAISQYYRFIWNLFYAEYIFFPLI